MINIITSGAAVTGLAPLCLALSLPMTALAQAPAPGSADLRATLGECPDDLLRQAWLKEHPLQIAAVEIEVLAICTERSEEIERSLQAQARLDRAVAQVLAPTPTAPVPGPIRDSKVEILHAEIRELRDRITRLEGAPEQPETAARLDQLRDDLAAAEGELARAEEAKQTTPAPGMPQTSSDTSTDWPAPARDDETARIGAAQAAPADPDPDPIMVTVLPLDTQTRAAPPAAPRSATTHASLPPDRPTEWQVIHAVRQGEGPWQVRLRGTREIAISVPGATAEDPPTIRWQTVTEPPVTLTVGETLPDGLVLRAVTAEGVTLTDPIAPEDDPTLLSFTSDGDNEPGELEWQVITLTNATKATESDP